MFSLSGNSLELPINEQMLSAIKEDNWAKVSELLKNHGERCLTGPDGVSLFLVAVDLKSRNIIRFIVLQNIKHLSAEGKLRDLYYTPLALAIIKQDNDLLEFLISLGADINHPSQSKPPLEIARETGNEEIIKTILNNKLTIAVLKQDFNEIQEIIDAGAELDPVKNKNNSPLMTAIKENKYDAMRYLIKIGAKLYANQLILAAKQRGVIALRILYEAGADLSQCSVELIMHALEALLSYQDGTALKFLINITEIPLTGLDPTLLINLITCSDHRRMSSDYFEIISLLISKRVDIDTPDKQGRAPIVLAAQGELDGVVQKLIDAGADIRPLATYLLLNGGAKWQMNLEALLKHARLPLTPKDLLLECEAVRNRVESGDATSAEYQQSVKELIDTFAQISVNCLHFLQEHPGPDATKKFGMLMQTYANLLNVADAKYDPITRAMYQAAADMLNPDAHRIVSNFSQPKLSQIPLGLMASQNTKQAATPNRLVRSNSYPGSASRMD